MPQKSYLIRSLLSHWQQRDLMAMTGGFASLVSQAISRGQVMGLSEWSLAGFVDRSAPDVDEGLPNLLDPETGTGGLNEPVLLQTRDLFTQLPFNLSSSHPRLRNLVTNNIIYRIPNPWDRPIDLDILRPVAKVEIVLQGQVQPWMLITQARLPRLGGRRREIAIQAGSVWILARSLVPTAPANAYVGFQVLNGQLRLPARPNISGQTVTVNASAGVELDLTLRPTSVPELDNPSSPQNLGFQWTVSEPSVSASPAAVTVRHLSFDFEPTNRLTYDSENQQLVISYTVTPNLVSLNEFSTSAFTVEGQSDLGEAGWGIPITQIDDPSLLPEAAGQGTWRVSLADTCQANWENGPKDGVTLTSALLLIWSDGYAVVDRAASRGGLWYEQKFALWQLPGSQHRASFTTRLAELVDVALGVNLATGPFVRFTAVGQAGFDRPFDATGSLLASGEEPVEVLLQGEVGAQTIDILPTDLEREMPWQRRILVLENVCLAVSVPRFAGLRGAIAEDNQIRAAHTVLSIPVAGWTPTLPDPYVSNAALSANALRGEKAVTRLLAVYNWQEGEADLNFVGSLVNASFPLAPRTISASPQSSAQGSAKRHSTQTQQGAIARKNWRLPDKPIQRNDDGVADQRYGEALGAFAEAFPSWSHGCLLLDVSTAQHQVGIQLGTPGSSNNRLAGNTLGHRVRLQVGGMRAGTPLAEVRVFALPQIQWEPVRTLDKDQDPVTLGIFPTPLASASDGGPVLMGTGANVQRLVPTIPELTLDGLVNAHQGGDGVTVFTTLPFGMAALMQLRPQQGDGGPVDGMAYVQPAFADPDRSPLLGAMQVSLTPGATRLRKEAESPSFEGMAVQTRNGVLLSTGSPMDISVLGATAGGPGDVESTFNSEFATGNPCVPLTRYDICGYGASSFSDWANPKGAFAEATKVQFQVMVGRTALEIVKIASVLYPWGIRLTRSVTIERKGGGGVIRRDSGWQALGPGLFDFTTDSSADPFVIHPGLVQGLYNIERVRPLADEAIVLGEGGRVLPMAFDADVAIEGLDGNQRTRSKGIVGFLHLRPEPDPGSDPEPDPGSDPEPEPDTDSGPISVDDLAELIELQGAIGGPVDAMLNLGGSGLRARALRMEVGLSRHGGPRFVGAVRVTPEFGPSGAWSVVRSPGPSNPEAPLETTAVTDGVPVVRQGSVGPTDSTEINVSLTGPYRFADPADLFNPDNPATDYGFMQSDTTHRFLFRRPFIPTESRRVESVLPPAFADFFAATTSKGLFPPLDNTIELSNTFGSYQLDIGGLGFLSLPERIDIAAPRPDLVLSEGGDEGMRVSYQNSRLRFGLIEDDWFINFSNLEIWNDFSSLRAANGTKISLAGGLGLAAQLDGIESLLHQDIQAIVSPIPGVSNPGIYGPIGLGVSNLKIGSKISIGIDDTFPKGQEGSVLPIQARYYAMLDFVTDTTGGVIVFGAVPYLGVRTGFDVRITLASGKILFLFGLLMEIGHKHYFLDNTTKTIRRLDMYVGFGIGKILGPFEAKVAVGIGIRFVEEGGAFGQGVFVFLEIKVDVQIVKMKVTGEFAGICFSEGGNRYTRWSGEMGLQITLAWILSIKFTANVSSKERISPSSPEPLPAP
jgi:hypothetical protein